MITAYHYDHALNSPANRRFVAAYNGDYRRNPDIYSVGGYDGMHVIYEALKKTGGKADAQSLVDGAKGLAWESPRGRVSIDPETRDTVNTGSIRNAEQVGGQLRNGAIDRS